MLPRRLSTNRGYTPIGAFSTQINLLQPNPQRDADGPLADITFAQVWAAITPIRQKYIEKTQQVLTEATYKVIIRYIPGVTSAMKVQLPEGQVWLIEDAVDPDQRKVELELFCYQRNDGA